MSLQAEIVSEASQRDLLRIQELLPRAFAGTNTTFTPDNIPANIERVINAEDADWIVVRNEQGVIISTLIVNIIYQSLGITVKVDEVATDPDYRRQGCASLTLNKAIEWAKKREARLLSLQSEQSMKPAHTCYRDVGFEDNTNMTFLYRL